MAAPPLSSVRRQRPPEGGCSLFNRMSDVSRETGPKPAGPARRPSVDFLVLRLKRALIDGGCPRKMGFNVALNGRLSAQGKQQ